MQNLTLGDIGTALAFIVGVVGSVEYLIIRLNKIFDKKLKPMEEAICKDFLVEYLEDKEMGKPIDPVREQRAYEVYDRYSLPVEKGGLGCNSYIHDKWEKLMK